ncbi:MAG TPA: tRNA threonylcarbamoyladenosine biosynthesis protein RimN [Gammaproteobacteria bacterium]|nr:tRNA threonylcarbamoyladenosine biosynthesis protein RimN [Gammaproteobacteria bacterium]
MNWHIHEAVRQLAAGGIVAYPTETVYGLGCDPFNGQAVLHLLSLKKREVNQGLILVASEFSQLEPLLQPLKPAAIKRICSTPATPVTWVLPCLPGIPAWLRGNHDSLAIRVTSHPIAADLCAAWGGPLVSTSANIHGRQPTTSPLQVRKAFSGQLDYILHGPRGNNTASEIRNGLTGAVLQRGSAHTQNG